MRQLAVEEGGGREGGECHVSRTKYESSTSLQLLIRNGLNVSHLQVKKEEVKKEEVKKDEAATAKIAAGVVADVLLKTK